MNMTRTGVFMMIYRMNTSYDVLVGRSAFYVATLLYVGCDAGQSGSNLLIHKYDPLEMC